MTTDAERLKQKRRNEEDVRRQREADLLAVMSAPSGRRFVWRLLETSGVFAASFTGEPLASAYGEGRRAVGLALMAETQRLAKAEYLLMVAEQLNELRLAPTPEAPPPAEE